jgi:hypothetical protein
MPRDLTGTSVARHRRPVHRSPAQAWRWSVRPVIVVTSDDILEFRQHASDYVGSM